MHISEATSCGQRGKLWGWWDHWSSGWCHGCFTGTRSHEACRCWGRTIVVDSPSVGGTSPFTAPVLLKCFPTIQKCTPATKKSEVLRMLHRGWVVTRVLDVRFDGLYTVLRHHIARQLIIRRRENFRTRLRCYAEREAQRLLVDRRT